MAHPSQKAAVRRLKAAAVRVESQPYRFNGTTRAPRLAPRSTGIFWCTPSSSIAAGGNIQNQTIRSFSNGVFTTVTTAGTVYNHYGAAFSSGKVMSVALNSDGTYSGIAQSCT